MTNTASCARELNNEIRVISQRWQLRKNWSAELSLNIVLREGREWLGTLQSVASAEFAAMATSGCARQERRLKAMR
jgi:hypothetical protein